MVEENVGDRASVNVTRWRRMSDVVALLLTLGTIVYGIGDAINGISGEYGSGWYLGSAFNYIDALIAVVAVFLVVWLRVRWEPAQSRTSGVARSVLVLTLVISALVVVSAGIYAIEGFADHSLNYDAGEKIGKVITALADFIVASAAATFAASGLSLFRTSNATSTTRSA
jgi:hypothetical protein